MINADAIDRMKPGVMLINTSRGGLIDTKAVIAGIKSGKIGYLGIDVYEQEENLFFADWSDSVIQDDEFLLLQSFSNVVITAHQVFFTRNALHNIAETTLGNISDFEQGYDLTNEVKPPELWACVGKIPMRASGRAVILIPRSSVAIQPRVGGRVVALNIRPGDRVKKG